MSKTRISEWDARCHFQDHKATPRCCCAPLGLGVPSKVSFSRFLSLIRLRLLADPERTNSTHFAQHHMSPSSFFFYKQQRPQFLAKHQIKATQGLSDRRFFQIMDSIIPRRGDADGGGGGSNQNNNHLLLPSTGPMMNFLPAFDVKVSSYVHFICKSSREEDLRHRF